MFELEERHKDGAGARYNLGSMKMFTAKLTDDKVTIHVEHGCGNIFPNVIDIHDAKSSNPMLEAGAPIGVNFLRVVCENIDEIIAGAGIERKKAEGNELW